MGSYDSRASISRAIILAFGVLVVASYQACAPGLKSEQFSAPLTGPTGGLVTFESGSDLELASLTLLQVSCAACHNAANPQGGVANLVSVNSMVKAKLIIPGKPADSPLYKTIIPGAAIPMPEPPQSPLSNTDTQTIRDWILEIRARTVTTSTLAPTTSTIKTTTSSTTPTTMGPPTTAPTISFSAQVFPFLTNQGCVACHNTRAPNLANYTAVLATLTPGNPTGSRLYQSIAPGGRMTGYVVGAGDGVELVRLWILQGAANN